MLCGYDTDIAVIKIIAAMAIYMQSLHIHIQTHKREHTHEAGERVNKVDYNKCKKFKGANIEIKLNNNIFCLSLLWFDVQRIVILPRNTKALPKLIYTISLSQNVALLSY